MKKLIAYSIVAVLALGSWMAYAEDQPTKRGPGAGKGAKHHEPGDLWERLKEPLGLTPDQVEEIKQIGEESREAVKKVRDDDSLARPEKRSAMMQIRKEMQEEIESVLTPEQKTQLEEIKQGKKERERRGDREGKKKGKKSKEGDSAEDKDQD